MNDRPVMIYRSTNRLRPSLFGSLPAKQVQHLKWISQAILLGIIVVAGMKVATLLGAKISLSDGQSYAHANPTVSVASIKVPRHGIFELTLTAMGNYKNPYLLLPGDNTTPGFVVGIFTGP